MRQGRYLASNPRQTAVVGWIKGLSVLREAGSTTEPPRILSPITTPMHRTARIGTMMHNSTIIMHLRYELRCTELHEPAGCSKQSITRSITE